MALPFFDTGARKKRNHMVAIDLGGRTTKAVYLERRESRYLLNRYAVLDAPIYEKSLSVELLTEHFKSVAQALDAKGKLTSIAVGVEHSIMRHVEMPSMPVGDMRMVLKNNSRNYLQEDLANYVYDCFIVLHRTPPGPSSDAGKRAGTSPKQKVLVAGAKKQMVDDFMAATKAAGLLGDHLVPGLLGPINAFEAAMPDRFAQSVVALVDIGFKHTSIAIMAEGELVLSRVVAIGGDRLSAGLAENMGISYAEAESIKVGMAGEVESALESLLTPLGRELRASVDFFEHQQDRPIQQVYVSGGSAKSEFILQSLQSEIVVECKTWLPTTFLQLALPPAQMAEFDQVAPQLTTALGAALTAL